MRSAKLLPLTVIAALSTACTGGGATDQDDPATGGTAGENAPAATDTAPAKPPRFEDFPGDGVVYTEMNHDASVKIKAIDSTWAAQVMDTPAPAGNHYLVVWVAATPNLSDRAANKISINEQFYVRYKQSDTPCKDVNPMAASPSEYCFVSGKPGSVLEVLNKADWRRRPWVNQPYTRSDIQRGETQIGQIGFRIDDKTQATAFELCVPTPEHTNSFEVEKYPCTPVKAPDGSR